MIEIPEPPDIRACASCMSALLWLWSPRKGEWVSFATEPTDTHVLRVHRCRDRDARLPSWRDRPPFGAPPEPDVAERVHRHAAMAGEVLRQVRERSADNVEGAA